MRKNINISVCEGNLIFLVENFWLRIKYKIDLGVILLLSFLGFWFLWIKELDKNEFLGLGIFVIGNFFELVFDSCGIFSILLWVIKI